MGAGYKGYEYTEVAKLRFSPKHLLKSLKDNGVEYDEQKILLVARTVAGNLLWLSTGNEKSGFKHIVKEHSNSFEGINIIDLIKRLTQTKPIKHLNQKIGNQWVDIFIYIYNNRIYLLVCNGKGYILTFLKINQETLDPVIISKLLEEELFDWSKPL